MVNKSRKIKKDNQLVDRITLVASLAGPIISLPQLFDIFHNQSASGVSISAWIGFEVLTFIWIWYAIAHKNTIILVGQILYVIIQLAIIIGAIMYGGSF